MKIHPSRAIIVAAAAIAVCAALFLPARNSRAQDNNMEIELTARARLFPDVGPGIKAVKRDAADRYYFLSTTDHAVRVYAADNTYLGQIPTHATGAAAIVYGQDMDVDAAGRVYVADRGASAVKVYTHAGKLALSIPVNAPTSVAALPSGEIAVAAMKSGHLVTVYDMQGKDLREFGDLSDLAEHARLNRLLNIGRLADDPANHIYYAFSYLPEPTIRKYDAYGYSSYQISLTTLDIYPTAQAMRRAIYRLDQRSAPPQLQKVIDAVGVDPVTQEVWVALGDDLMKFDKDGNRVGKYRTLTTSGEDLAATSILIEPHRLLLADDPHGIFEFARPDQPATPAPKTK
ncbi:MAG: NHL repeat-containing protein [Candidatus Acidiferrales bacterium]